MRIFFLGNNRLAVDVLRYLRAREEQIVGVALHPPERRKCGTELLQLAGGTPIYIGGSFGSPEHVQRVADLKPDIAISILYGYVLRPQFLQLFPHGCVNLHLSLLPYNRGAHPNVWPIVDGTPAGVTLHYMDSEIDAGPIIAQREVPVEPVDTGRSLYRKLEREALRLFRDVWPQVRAGQVESTAQELGEGTFHRVRDLEKLGRIDLESTYRARDLINILRARTFPPYPGAYFVENGKRIYLRLYLRYGHKDTEFEGRNPE